MVFDTTATHLYLDYVATSSTTTSGTEDAAILVNGKLWAAIVHTKASPAMGQEAVTLPSGKKRVEVVFGAVNTSNAPSAPALTAKHPWAVFVDSIDTAVIYPVRPARTLVIYGDSISCGGVAPSPEVQSGLPGIMRSRWPGSVVIEAWGSRSLKEDSNVDATFAVLASRIAAANPSDIWIAIGTNDFGGNYWSAASFGTAYATMLDAIHAACPGARIWAQSPLFRTGETTPNGSGSTLPDYRTQISTVCGSRAFVTYVDGKDALLTGISFSGDGVHLDGPGQRIWGDLLVTKLGV